MPVGFLGDSAGNGLHTASRTPPAAAAAARDHEAAVIHLTLAVEWEEETRQTSHGSSLSH
jgi:hypothetical protein